MSRNLISFGILLILLLGSISSTAGCVSNKQFILNDDTITTIGDIFEGYMLLAPLGVTDTYLIDIDESVVHSWTSKYKPGNSAYLLEDGTLLRTGSVGINSIFDGAGGIGGIVEIIDWNSTVIWSYTLASNDAYQHHDVESLPNGNILMIAWEYKTKNEAINAGRNPNLLDEEMLWPDKIVEVDPHTNNIVWEWHVWDHLIQDYDNSKDNYGVIAEHPELADLNYVGNPTRAVADWNHINAVDYNEEFDQIILSVHNFGEIWVIDHSTTSVEAASHIGGAYGKGGDILYRWGNPQTYDAGTSNDKILNGQHDAQWIEDDCPGAGNILIFNNRAGGSGPSSYSSVVEIIPEVDRDGFYTEPAPGEAFGPADAEWMYTADNPSDFYSESISGASRLANGNTFICEGNDGYIFEVTSDGDLVWEYQNEYGSVNPKTGKKMVNVFRAYKYPYDYPGLNALSQQPDKPNTPDGPTSGSSGTKYNYTTSTVDPEGNQVYYWFDWDDGSNSGWIGPYNSGEECTASHTWTSKGTYEIKVKAKDSTGAQSEWSDPLSISMPKAHLGSILQIILTNIYDILSERFWKIISFNLYRW